MKRLDYMQNRTTSYADAAVYATWAGNFVNGKKGAARAKSGGKHYIRSRIRCKENAKLKKEMTMLGQQ